MPDMPDMPERTINRLALGGLLALVTLFGLWAARLIGATSSVALDGRRYFCLFDDAMISMRYAWNLAHGHGLVWNPGEHVEGYTNLLMVLVMAVPNAVLEPRFAVLAVQVFGALTMIGIALLAGQVAVLLQPGAGANTRAALRLLCAAAVLLYYPLAYWSLLGMETGLLALCVLAAIGHLLRYEQARALRDARRMAILIGLAYLTRPESLLLGGLLLLEFCYVTLRAGDGRRGWRTVLGIVALAALLPLGQHVFRWAYYDGALFANTYTLKAEGLPLRERLGYGWDYSAPFLREHALLLILAGLSAALPPRRERLLLAALVITLIGYQVFVGGDVPVWRYWRMVAPVMPLALVLAGGGLARFYAFRPGRSTLLILLVTGGAAYLSAVERFREEQTFQVEPYQASLNAINVNTALLLAQITTPDATLGVTWAGTVPYYNPARRAIDYLGKSDPYIARLTPAPDDPLRGWPGHNKHDYTYSIQTLQPTYSQGFSIGSSDVTAWGRAFYTALVYDPNTVLFLKTGDPAVRWDRVLAAGLFPWLGWNTDAFFSDPAALEAGAALYLPANTLGISAPAIDPAQLDPDGRAALDRWQISHDPAELRAAGIAYLLVDHAWWDTLDEAGRATLDDPASYILVKEWRVDSVFIRLYRVGDAG